MYDKNKILQVNSCQQKILKFSYTYLLHFPALAVFWFGFLFMGLPSLYMHLYFWSSLKTIL